MSGLLHALVENAARDAGCTIAQVLGPCRRMPIARARQRAMCAAYEAGFSTEQIGRAFNRHHTTVLYAAGALSGKPPAWRRDE